MLSKNQLPTPISVSLLGQPHCSASQIVPPWSSHSNIYFEPDIIFYIFQGGLASAFSQMRLGEPSPAATVQMQEHLRRSAWEQGTMDFMGADAFDNIWRKIMDTVSKPPNK